MKRARGNITGFRTLLCIGFLLGGFFTLCTHGESSPAPAQNKDKSAIESDKDHTIRVAVEEVRLDAVVLDKKGRPITDLTAKDFEIFQDGERQKILSCIYITNQSESSASPALPGIRTQTQIPLPAPDLNRDEVRRVLVFVIDDISMGFESLHYARLSLTRFVERQMQPGDLVAILRTGSGNSALQMFLSDKEQLLNRIDKIAWGANAGFSLVNSEMNIDSRARNFDAQLAALKYSLGALKDLPGRKTILLLSAQPTIPTNLSKDFFGPPNPFNETYYRMYVRKFNRLGDEALRAGVVVHLMDIRGLEAPFPDIHGPDGVTPSSFPGGGSTYEDLSERRSYGLNPLPEKTGGIFLENSNFFVDGIGEVNDMLQGYYLLSYAPPEKTFKSGKKNSFHSTIIKVNRSGATVHTRDGFYGVTDDEEESLIVPDPLQEAIYSPFRYSDLGINMASGYIDDFKGGYLLRSWLYLDARDVTFMKQEEGGYLVSLETVGITTDVSGYIQDSGLMHYRHLFRVQENNLSAVKKQGIRFSVLLPVKKSGGYYERVAVRDTESGKVGSAYQYIEIPDLKKDRLALSNIFVINNKEDADWILSGENGEVPQNGMVPILRRVDGTSPAASSYRSGDYFKYMYVIYSAKSAKNGSPDLESRFVLYRDGSQIYESDPQPLALKAAGSFARIPISGRLLLGDLLKEGDYVMQLFVNDKNRNKKDGLASQTISFKIVP